jgi:hypothetical protein
MVEKEYVSFHDVPYEVSGTYLNGDKKLIIYGTMKEFCQFQSMNVIKAGRFSVNDLVPITKECAEILKDKLLLPTVSRDDFENVDNY